jgi:hypothetical protein
LPQPQPGETFDERVRTHAKKFIGRGEPGASEIMANLFDPDLPHGARAGVHRPHLVGRDGVGDQAQIFRETFFADWVTARTSASEWFVPAQRRNYLLAK